MAKNESEEVVIEIPKDLETSFWPELCIYRVPSTIRSINGEAYTPQVISIGPIHHKNQALRDMDIQKKRYLKEFCKRLEVKLTQNEVMRKIWDIMKEKEVMIRRCYEDTTEISSNEFVKMIVLDAVFIMELFLRYHKVRDYEKNDYILGRPSQREVVEMELLLLENQLPYFVLTELYQFYISNSPQQNLPFQDNNLQMSFYKLACNYFGMAEQAEPNNSKHFVDWVRYIMLKASPLQLRPPKRDPVKLKYSATKLHQAGVEFKVAEGKRSLLEIEFEKGVLKIPPFELHRSLESIFRNIMALEQCHYPFQTYIVYYFFLMDHLINTAEDVELLVEAGIIVNCLGSNQMVADLINRLCQGIGEYASCYSDICDMLNEYYEKPWNHRKATLKAVYFSDLWIATGTIAAALLLIMTLIQTITSIKSLF